MPRITECLAQRQEVAPEESDSGKPCSFGCTGVCVGPKCPGQKTVLSFSLLITPLLELLAGLNGGLEASGDVDGNEGSIDARQSEPNEQGDADTVDTEYDSESEYDVVTDDYSTDDYSTDDYSSDDYATEETIEGSADYYDTVEETTDNYDFDYAAEDNIEVDIPLDLPLGKQSIQISKSLKMSNH